MVFVGEKFTDYVLKLFKYVVIDDTIRLKNILENNNLMFLYGFSSSCCTGVGLQEMLYLEILYDVYEVDMNIKVFNTCIFNGIVFLYFQAL